MTATTRRHAAASTPAPGYARSWWLREALAAEGDTVAPAPPLGRDTRADVVIVGGGYTGLWAAYHLTEQAPGIDVVVLEQDICGGGASGRNGGLVTGWWDEIERLVTLFGDDNGLRLARALGTSIRSIGAWCADHGVDAWYHRAGYVGVATTAPQRAVVDHLVATARRLGVGEELDPLTAEEVRRRCASPAFGDGFLMRDGATVQPARLARGLRRVLLERGVRIHERTTVTAVREETAPIVATTSAGSVTAGAAVVAVNAWGAAWRRLRRLSVPRGSYMVLTEPIPDALEELGWTGHECLTDMRTTTHYVRTTEDGRIAFGGGGASTGVGPRIGKTFTHDVAAVRRTVEGFRHLFPTLDGVCLTDAWGGPIDVGPSHLPVFGQMGTGRCFYAVGYTGNGVGPSHLGGRILAGLCLESEDEWTTLPLADFTPLRYPPEPIRSLGAYLVNAAVVRKDRQEERKGASGRLTSFVARLPTKLGYSLPPE